MGLQSLEWRGNGAAIRFRQDLLWRGRFGLPLRWRGKEYRVGVEVKCGITCSPWGR